MRTARRAQGLGSLGERHGAAVRRPLRWIILWWTRLPSGAAPSVSRRVGPVSDLHRTSNSVGSFASVAGRTERAICVDIDNTIADTDSVLRRLIRQVSHDRVRLAHEDVVCYEYWKCRDARGHRLTPREWRKVVDRFHRDRLEEIPPFPGVAEHLARLGQRFEIHLATTRDPVGEAATRIWLRRHGIPHDRLHFARHGEKHRIPYSFDFAIEDDREQAYAFLASGVTAIVLGKPWNLVGPSSPVERLPDWSSIAARLADAEGAGTVRAPPSTRVPDAVRD